MSPVGPVRLVSLVSPLSLVGCVSPVRPVSLVTQRIRHSKKVLDSKRATGPPG